MSIPYRTVPVSFTRRGGRLNERQQSAWDTEAHKWLIDVPRNGPSTSVDPAYRFDPSAAFGRSSRLVVEVGSGRGEVLAHAAAQDPGTNFLGLEVYRPGVAQTLVRLRHDDITNVRLVMVNATEALATMVSPSSVDELWINFPDPWHKKRHHKRRLVTPGLAALAARVLRSGGMWRLSTDWSDYAEQMAQVLHESPDFSGGPSARFDGRVRTHFENKGIVAGREIHDFCAQRL